MSLNGIFLSGWEYNRLLVEDPIAPAQSALPAEALWNGCAQFWLFENIYTTKEALEGEMAAAEVLGWSTGYIFGDLKKRGFIRTFDLQSLRGESELEYNNLISAHRALRQQNSESDIRSLLLAGDDARLEDIKLRFLAPVVSHLRCVPNISINSIRQWESHRNDDQTHVSGAMALARIAEPLSRQTPIRSGMKLCNPPGTGVPEDARLAQRTVEQEIQRPMIPDLLSGRLSQKDYMNELLPTVNVYRPVDEQLLREYQQNIEKLERLRDLAKLHLWKDLHGDWLPRLHTEPSFAKEFQALIRDALLRSHFDPYLEWLTIIGIIVDAALVRPLLGDATVAATLGVLTAAHKSARESSSNLAAFYQKARRLPNS